MEGCKISSPASAQDLRSFYVKKEKEENASPRRVLEGCVADLGTEEGSAQIQEPEIRSSKLEVLFCWRRFFKMWKRGSIKQFPSFRPLVVPKISRSKSISARENIDVGFCYFKSPWNNFTLSKLQRATKNFSQENMIGRGGYAEVYRGCLPNGQLVATKVLNRGALEDQIIGFLSEIGTIAHINHPNTAKLIGFGVEGGTYLVLQLSPLGSLGSLLRGSREKLQWAIRYKIILGTAAGLLYLHENCQRRIIHRDIKADNVLLTKDFEPQGATFRAHYRSVALDDSQKSLVLWAKPLLDNNNVKELVKHSLGENYNPEEMDRVILTASLCIEQCPILRPWMSQVGMLLRGENHKLCFREHQKGILQRAFSRELLDAEEYNLTKHLSDLSRHKAVALGS